MFKETNSQMSKKEVSPTNVKDQKSLNEYVKQIIVIANNREGS